MERAWLSSRVSSGPQARQGGHRRQESAAAVAAARRWCEAHGYELQGSLRFTGSAYKGRHMAAGAPQREWLERAIRGELGHRPALLVEQVDRLTRQAGHATDGGLAELLYRAFPAGVVIVDLGEGVTYSTEAFDHDDRLLGDLIEEVRLAHRESAKKARRLRSHWSQVREDLAAGRVVRARHVAPWWVGTEGGRWVLNEHADLARRIFTLAESRGSSAITRLLNTEGVVPPGRRQGPRWTATAVVATLRNPAAWGCCRLRGMDLLPGVFPPVVEREQWELVQARILERVGDLSTRGHKPAVRWIGAGLTTCTCGWAVGVASSKHRRGLVRRYLGCLRRRDHGPVCPGQMVRLELATAHLLTRLNHGQLAALLATPGRDDALAAAQQRARTASDTLAVAVQRRERAEGAVRAAVLRGQQHELLLDVANETRAAEREARQSAAEAAAALAGLQRGTPAAEVEGAVSELLLAVAEERDTVEQRQAVNEGLAGLGVRLALAADRPAMGIALGDGEFDWQPVHPAQSRYLADGVAGIATQERMGEVAIHSGNWVELVLEPD